MTPTPYVKQTWIDGDNTKPVSAARLGVIETGVFDAHYRPSVSVWRSAAQSLATGTSTAITWDTELYDTDAMHSTSSNTSRLVAPVAGKYAIKARGSFAANATGIRSMVLRVNGTTTIETDQDAAPVAAGNTFLLCCTDYLLAANDYVEVLAVQNSGGNLNFGGTTRDVAHFEMHLASY